MAAAHGKIAPPQLVVEEDEEVTAGQTIVLSNENFQQEGTGKLMESTSPPVIFPLLKNPKAYDPQTIPWRTPVDAEEKITKEEKAWIEVFRKSIPSFRKRAEEDTTVANAPALAARFQERYGAILDEIEQDPNSNGGPPSIMLLCKLRELSLRELGFSDIFKKVKEHENTVALKLLPLALKEVDAITDPGARMEHLLKCMLAGNLLDLGVHQFADAYEEKGFQFHDTLARLLPRPWVLDDVEAFKSAWEAKKFSKVVMFVDNAGADFVLGAMPLAREFIRQGTQVIITANDMPAINDITYFEVLDIIHSLSTVINEDIVLMGLDRGQLLVVNSGSDLPVLDLSAVSPELAYASEDAELVIFCGMGRGIETNLHARLKCSSLSVGMVKHQEVADFLGGRLYDGVVKFTEQNVPPTPTISKGAHKPTILADA